MKNWFKNQTGSITVYVTICILSFMIILVGVLYSASAIRKNQLRTIVEIKKVYEQDLDNSQEIYAEQEKLRNYVQVGLIAYYDAINNTGNGHDSTATVWKDLSGNGNDITLYNFNGSEISGWSDSALNFDGSDDYAYTKNPLYNQSEIPENITIEVISARNNSSVYGTVLSFGMYANTKSQLDLWTGIEDTRSYEVQYYSNYEIADTPSYLAPISFADYPINTIKSITYGKNGSTYFTYLNSEKRDEQTITDNVNWFENTLYLGRANNDDYYFNGVIKSVRIYNRTLTQEEIEQNYRIDKEKYGI